MVIREKMAQVITKLEAATRQLDCAIELFFSEKDVVSIHTLACAAHQIIHNINRDQNGPELLFDNVDTSISSAKVDKKILHKHYNFFKHADKDPCPNCGLWFDNDITEIFLLSAIIGVYYITGSINTLQTAFINYLHINESDFLSKDIIEFLKGGLNDAIKNKLIGCSKQDFLKEYFRVLA